MIDQENKRAFQEIDVDKLLKGYAEVIFNTWRMGKNVKEDYNANKKKIDDVNNRLNDFIDLLDEVDKDPRINFVEDFNLVSYKKKY